MSGGPRGDLVCWRALISSRADGTPGS